MRLAGVAHGRFGCEPPKMLAMWLKWLSSGGGGGSGAGSGRGTPVAAGAHVESSFAIAPIITFARQRRQVAAAFQPHRTVGIPTRKCSRFLAR